MTMKIKELDLLLYKLKIELKPKYPIALVDTESYHEIIKLFKEIQKARKL